MPAGRGDPELGSVAFDSITNPRRLTRLGIHHLNVGDIDPGFLVNDPAAAVTGRLLMSLDHSRAFNLDLAARRRHGQHSAALPLVTSGRQDHLIVLLDFRSLARFHNQMTSGARETI